MSFQWTDAISRSTKPDQSRKGVADPEAAAEAAVVLEEAVAADNGVNPAGNLFYSVRGMDGLKPPAHIYGQGTGRVEE